ncbi:MAG: hypothetical protein COV72_05060 [Candidatus Omnitrophica bacterium CG11_big_fil_rev_8_21_14_0_20_42_13]|uniref:Fimbrial assembly protein n=1 Tax=Candidatus Ghiorseimicrobium undicola TaxID=1974746 RepID=A0A2H0LX64_9BACT|nr:MAG: hypothetical protein COV72_05060 [Candidatus Omnitrophica bacterium CG11_big_fil_rev_8_21_14_0_20_42_13]
MIEINLLPENLRLSKAKKGIDFDAVVYFAKLALIVLVGLHVLLLFSVLFYKYRVSSLGREWSHISSKNADVIKLKKDVEGLEARLGITNKLAVEKSRWARRLNSLSLLLPKGIWFNRMRASDGILDITGSVISLKGEEVDSLHKFLQALKKDKFFYSGFKSMEIVSIVRSNVSGVEVIDFSIRGVLE